MCIRDSVHGEYHHLLPELWMQLPWSPRSMCSCFDDGGFCQTCCKSKLETGQQQSAFRHLLLLFLKKGNNSIKTRGKVCPLICIDRKNSACTIQDVPLVTCCVGSCPVWNPFATSVRIKSELPCTFFSIHADGSHHCPSMLSMNAALWKRLNLPIFNEIVTVS